jgi:hypothetical protein
MLHVCRSTCSKTYNCKVQTFTDKKGYDSGKNLRLICLCLLPSNCFGKKNLAFARVFYGHMILSATGRNLVLLTAALDFGPLTDFFHNFNRLEYVEKRIQVC